MFAVATVLSVSAVAPVIAAEPTLKLQVIGPAKPVASGEDITLRFELAPKK